MKKILLLLVVIFITGVVSVEAQTTQTCTNCGGRGYTAVCSYCGGSGAVYTMFGWMPCPGCGGSGKVVCMMCLGKGYIVWNNTSNSSYYTGTVGSYNTSSSSSTSSYNSGLSSSSSSSSSNTDLCLNCCGDGKCPSCHGSGYRTDNMFGTGVDYEHKCGVCGGSGKCNLCNGKGRR